MNIEELLKQVKSGALDIEEAERRLRDLPYEDLGYAKLDHHRKIRSGFPETVFCQGKPDEYLAEIFKKLYESNGEVLGTRASEHQYELVRELIPEIIYDPVARILKAEPADKEQRRKGLVAVCTGGTADIPVAEEAAQTAEFFGCRVSGSTTWAWPGFTGCSVRERNLSTPAASSRWRGWKGRWARSSAAWWKIR